MEYGDEDDFAGSRLSQQHQGTFASSRTYKQYPNPGISIKNLGLIGLPLSTRDAKAIAGECKQAPFGKGDQTLVDDTARKTWKLDSNNFSCDNPEWNLYLEELARQTMQDLGVEIVGHAQPYKLLLYKEGAFFKAHRDTEKVPGMFGTLVVCLPSAHDGGSVKLVHGKKERTIETALTSAFEMTTLAWYADVQHEIAPVTSGYHLVLTYNLVQDPSAPKQTAAALDANHARLNKLLKTWTNDHVQQKMFIYPLEHQYTQSSLSLDNLKGQDAAKGRFLEALCSKNGLYWFLRRLTKSEKDDPNHYYDEEDEESFSLEKTVLPNGKKATLLIDSIEETDILADTERYEDRSADSEEEGEYIGNKGMANELHYHDTVAIMIQKDHAIKQITQLSHLSAELLLALFDLISSDGHCPENLRLTTIGTILEKCLHFIVSKNHGYNRYDFSSISYRPTVENQADAVNIFETVAAFCHNKRLGHLVRSILKKGMKSDNWDNCEELVSLIARQITKEANDGAENLWNDWLATPVPTVTTYKYVHEHRNTFETIGRILPPTTRRSFDEWTAGQFDSLLRSVSTYTREDVEPLIQLILRFHSRLISIRRS